MKWQELNGAKRRKAIILAAFVGLAILALLWPSGTSRPRRAPVRRPARTTQHTGVGTPPPRPQPATPAKDAGLLGKWQSMGLQVKERGMCTLWVEVIRDAQASDQYTGAASLSCTPIPTPANVKPDAGMNQFLTKMQPLSATLSGAWQKDAIAFKVGKLLNGGECGLQGLSVSRFGSQYLAAEFQDGCGGGSAVMRKAG